MACVVTDAVCGLCGVSGETVVIDTVMLVGDKGNTTVGQPYVKGASVTAVIEQLTLVSFPGPLFLLQVVD